MFVIVTPGTMQKQKRQKMMLQRHSCEKLPGISMESRSEDNMELDDEDEDEDVDEDDEEPSLPEPEVIPPQTLEELELELACKPWILNLQELVLEKSGKSSNPIPQGQGSVAPVLEREVEEASKKKQIWLGY